jgi:hypothetical protein
MFKMSLKAGTTRITVEDPKTSLPSVNEASLRSSGEALATPSLSKRLFLYQSKSE